MCYPKPGPRCSRHARERLQRAIAAEATARKIYDDTLARAHNEAFDEYRSAYGPTPTGAEDMAAYADAEAAALNHPAVTEAAARLQQTERVAAAADRAYDATPDGITELEDRIHEWNPATGDDRRHLYTRLTEATHRRAEQIAAYKAATAHPVTGMSDPQLRAEMDDLIRDRLPNSADDRIVHVAEQARFNAVMNELQHRHTHHPA